MQEDGVDVYIRHRNELLKSIYDNIDAEQEVGDFLLSTLNLHNHGIKYDLHDADRICLSYSNYILQKADSDHTPQPYAAHRPAMMSTYGTDHQWRGRVKNSWTPDDDIKHGYSFFRPKRRSRKSRYINDTELHHSHMRNNRIPLSMKHALWPEVLPHRVRVNHKLERDENGHPTGRRVEDTEMELADTYRDRHPYDESHPMRRIRADTGMPEWENTLRNFYFSSNDDPSFAERLMDMEDKHKQHWSKRTQESAHGTYQGIDSGYGKKRFPFFGGGDKGHESATKHAHTLRQRDFDRWKEPVEGTEWDTPGHRERVAQLEEEGKDLEIEHFNDRMAKLNGHDVHVKRYDPAEGLSTEEIYDKDPKELEGWDEAHGHGMGWPTLNMGLEFLSPEERTLVMRHVNHHGTDHPDHQSVELEDGQRLHMSRIKKNMAMRQGVEDNWFRRNAQLFGANKSKHIETPADTLTVGDAGMATKALKETYLKDGFLLDGAPHGDVHDEKTGNTIQGKRYDETAYDMLKRNISDAYEGEKLLHYNEMGDSNLFPFDERDVKKIQGRLDKGKDLKEALKGHISRDSDVNLSADGLRRLVGREEDHSPSYPAGEFPIFEGQQEPFLPKSVTKEVFANLERLGGVGNAGPTIRNSHGAARQHLNGPDPEDPKLHSEEKEHYYRDGEKLRGWAYPFARPFTHVGGLGRQGTTQVELLHDFLSDDINEEYWDEEEGMYINPHQVSTSSMMGDKTHTHGGMITPNNDTIGLFGSMHPHVLPKGQSVHNTAHGIISKTDTTTHSQHAVGAKVGKGRNIKTNSTDFDSTRSPELASLIEYKNPSEKDYTMDVKGLSRGLDKQNFHESNPYTGGSPKAFVNAKTWAGMTDTERHRYLVQGETTMRNMAGISHMFTTANGRIRPPNDPAERMHYSYNDMVNDRGILSSKTTPHADFMQLIPTSKKTSVLDKLPEGFFDRVQALEDELYASPHDEWERKEIQSLLLPLKEKYDEVYQRQMRGTGQSGQRQKGYGWRERNDASMVADKRLIAERVRDHTIPLIEKEHPEAFHPENPLALANLLRAFRDTQRDVYINGGGDARTEGLHVREGEAKTASDRHFTLANLMKHMPENTINRDTTSVDEALHILGLPDDEAHREHVEKFMGGLSEPVHAFSLGQFANLGYPWDDDGVPQFGSLAGVGSMHGHLDELLDTHQQSTPKLTDYEPEVLPSGKVSQRHKTLYNEAREKYDTAFKQNPAYSALGALHHIARARQPVMDNYALKLYASPQPKSRKDADHRTSKDGRTLLHPSVYRGGAVRANNDHKDIASHILSFHPSEEPEGGLKANTPPIDKPSMGFYSAPIGSLDEQTGVVPHDHFSSDTMNWGYRMQPEIGIEHGGPGTDGAPTVGWNCPPEDFHSVARPLLQAALPNTDISTLLANAQVGEMTSEQTGADQPVDSVTKADLPKKVPLIEPMHRVFDVKDLAQLKGFTGEWVVSIHNEGQRCKVIKRGNRIRILDVEGERQSTSDTIRDGLRAICKKDYVIDGTLKGNEFHVNDILHYDDDDITDLSTRERIKILRGQFDSYDQVFIPSPSDIRITDDVGLKDAVRELSKESSKILLRDAKSTYMRGEEKHPKWVMLAKSDVDFHIPFSMEIDDSRFILHLPEDIVKYEIVDEQPVNPKAIVGGITDSDYSIRLAESLESYWEDGFKELLKEETEIEPEIDEERIEEESAGILKPKKDRNLIMKPREMYKALLLIEKVLDKMEKGFSNLSGRGLGIDVGGGVESPRGPTKLDAEQALPDWDMKKRPTQDSEKAEDYPGRKRKKRKTEAQYNELAERSLEG